MSDAKSSPRDLPPPMRLSVSERAWFALELLARAGHMPPSWVLEQCIWRAARTTTAYGTAVDSNGGESIQDIVESMVGVAEIDRLHQLADRAPHLLSYQERKALEDDFHSKEPA